MNKIQKLLTFTLIVLSTTVLAETNTNKAKAGLSSDKDKLSYAMGLSYSQSVTDHKLEQELNVPIFLQGMEDGIRKREPKLSENEVRQILVNFSEKKQAQHEALAKANKKAAEQYLAKHAKEKGVKTLANGIQYKELKKGNGKKPTKDNTVSVKYKGALLNGTEFDSSGDNGAIEIPLAKAIDGWKEAVTNMAVGSKWEFVVPANLAYGKQGHGIIGPNEPLLYKVELLAIVVPK